MLRSQIAATAFSLFLSVVCAWGQGAYKVTSTGAPTAAPASMQGLVEAQGTQFGSAQGAPLCEIWWRKGIPEQANSGGSSDVLYGGLSMGEFVGLIDFPAAAKDYRGQAIKPGYYTLRYALIPQDGNHMGVSSYRDFLLLVPVADDSSPSSNLSFNAVVKESRLATGTGHPAVLMLDPPAQGATFPSAAQDDQGNWALDVKLDVKAAPGQDQQLPFAVVLVGQYQG
ncbi:MAG: hypothetical protein ACRD3D_08360 [Terriglobia bacterium]